jgi:hypothetical protein
MATSDAHRTVATIAEPHNDRVSAELARERGEVLDVGGEVIRAVAARLPAAARVVRDHAMVAGELLAQARIDVSRGQAMREEEHERPLAVLLPVDLDPSGPVQGRHRREGYAFGAAMRAQLALDSWYASRLRSS